MGAIHVLLQHSIDYAGLFPPAGLDIEAAVENYAHYRMGPDSWALGRFVLPAERIAQFEAAARRHLSVHSGESPWQLTALLGSDLDSDLASIAEFNRRHAGGGQGRPRIDTVEARASSIRDVRERMHRIPDHLQAYIEVPIDGDPAGVVSAIAEAGRRSKVRTGGVTREAFPSSSDLVRFIVACIQAQVAFKATAGLHHPVRADYRLTYAPDSPSAPMFGFLNLFLAAAFLRNGMSEDEAGRVLEETSLQAFHFDDEAIHWRGRRLGTDELQRARREVIVSFGSCSFTEPLQELQGLHLLEPRVPQA